MQVSLPGQGDSADVVTLRILRWGGHPGISGCAWCNHKGPYRGDTGGVESRWSDDRSRGTGRNDLQVPHCWLWGGRRPALTQGRGWILELEKPRKQILPESPEGTILPTLDFSSTLFKYPVATRFQISSFQKRKRQICVVLSHRVCDPFVTAATGKNYTWRHKASGSAVQKGLPHSWDTQ